ncbi:MAG: LysR family transcriptional regulator [Advenella sp.]
MDLDLRSLRYFVAVAETLNFSKAAARLNISQPPLSLAIRQLEEKMGAQLFERNSRHVSLTPAGAMLYKEALFLLSHAGSLKNRLAHTTERGRLRLGFVGSMVYRGLPALLQLLGREGEQIDIELAESNSGDIIDKVAMGHVDVGFIHSNRLPIDLQDKVIVTEPFLLCAHKDNPILKKKTPALADFSAQRFIFFSRHVSPVYYEILLSMCISAGFFPKAVDETRHWLSILSMVSQNMGVSLVPTCMKHCGLPDLQFLEFAHTQRSITSVIWSRKKQDPIISHAIERIITFYDAV